MRVLMVGTLAGHGPARATAGWARMLAATGHEVLFITDGMGDLSLGISESPRVKVLSNAPPPWLPGLLQREWHARTLVREFNEDIEGFAPDCVVTTFRAETLAMGRHYPELPHVGTWCSPSYEEERLNLFRYGSPLKKLAFLVLSGRFRYQDRKSLSVVDVVHTHSRYTWQLLTRRYASECEGLSWKRIPGTVQPPPAIPKPDARHALGYGPDELLFVAVRRLVPRNGILRLVDTALRLRSEEINARLVVVGRGPLAQELRDSIRENDLEEYIELAGFVPDEQLALYYAAADATLMPTVDLECFGMPAIESLSYGTPCIATPCGSLQEVLAPFPKMLSESNQSESFASAVLDFARSVRSGNTSFEPDELRKHVGSFYSDDAIAKDVESLLLSVTTRHTR